MYNKVKTKVMTVGLAACLLLAGLFGLAWTDRKNVVTADALTIHSGGWGAFFDYIKGNPGPYPYIVFVEFEAVREDARNYASFDDLCDNNAYFQQFSAEAQKAGYSGGSDIFKQINLIMFIETDGPDSPEFIKANFWTFESFKDENVKADEFLSKEPKACYIGMFANGQAAAARNYYVFRLMESLEQRNAKMNNFALF